MKMSVRCCCGSSSRVLAASSQPVETRWLRTRLIERSNKIKAGSLRVADELGAATVAFPAISTGIFGWPIAGAAAIAVNAVRQAGTRVEQVRFVLFTEDAYEAFAQAID